MSKLLYLGVTEALNALVGSAQIRMTPADSALGSPDIDIPVPAGERWMLRYVKYQFELTAGDNCRPSIHVYGPDLVNPKLIADAGVNCQAGLSGLGYIAFWTPHVALTNGVFSGNIEWQRTSGALPPYFIIESGDILRLHLTSVGTNPLGVSTRIKNAIVDVIKI